MGIMNAGDSAAKYNAPSVIMLVITMIAENSRGIKFAQGSIDHLAPTGTCGIGYGPGSPYPGWSAGSKAVSGLEGPRDIGSNVMCGSGIWMSSYRGHISMRTILSNSARSQLTFIYPVLRNGTMLTPSRLPVV